MQIAGCPTGGNVCPLKGGEEQWPEFMGWIAGGGSLRKWCRDQEIPLSNMYAWIIKSGRRQEFDAGMITRADTVADEIDDLANECMAKEDFRTANQYRVAIDAKKWVAAMLNPKRYGQFLQVENREVTPTDKVKERIDQLEKKLGLKLVKA